MISLKKYLDSYEDDVSPCVVDATPDLLPLAIDAYRSALVEIGNCSLDACPVLGPDLRRSLGRFEETLSNRLSAGTIAATENGVRELLQEWGMRTSRHYQEKAAEVKDLLLVMAHTADSVGHRDQRCAHQIEAVTKDLETIATLEDLSAVRASIEKRATELRHSIDR